MIVVTVIIHVLGLGYIGAKAIAIYHDGGKRRRHPQIAFVVVLGASTLLATLLHAIETAIWAFAFCELGALTDFRLAMLYSLGAMTTYGHQNITLAAHWQLLGSIEALNGWLLFGLSTAFLFWLFQEITPSIQKNKG